VSTYARGRATAWQIQIQPQFGPRETWNGILKGGKGEKDHRIKRQEVLNAVFAVKKKKGVLKGEASKLWWGGQKDSKTGGKKKISPQGRINKGKVVVRMCFQSSQEGSQ